MRTSVFGVTLAGLLLTTVLIGRAQEQPVPAPFHLPSGVSMTADIVATWSHGTLMVDAHSRRDMTGAVDASASRTNTSEVVRALAKTQPLANSVVFRGNLTFVQNGVVIRADSAIYNVDTGEIQLGENARIVVAPAPK